MTLVFFCSFEIATKINRIQNKEDGIYQNLLIHKMSFIFNVQMKDVFRLQLDLFYSQKKNNMIYWDGIYHSLVRRLDPPSLIC